MFPTRGTWTEKKIRINNLLFSNTGPKNKSYSVKDGYFCSETLLILRPGQREIRYFFHVQCNISLWKNLKLIYPTNKVSFK